MGEKMGETFERESEGGMRLGGASEGVTAAGIPARNPLSTILYLSNFTKVTHCHILVFYILNPPLPIV